jgi:putative phosphonate catabolism associated alcohol dehydrogenase
MKTSRVAVFHGKDLPFTRETVPVPAPGSREILVRNEYTTLCRSDLNTFVGKRTEPTPTILGHEIVGRIEELGPGAPERDLRGAKLRVGDRITWAIYASDPESALARSGLPQKGGGLFKYGHERVRPDSHLHGGLSEYCLLRAHTPIVRVDAPVPLPVLALVNCAVATVAGSLRVAGGVAGREVLVAGAGMLGIVACAICRVAGAGRVIALDVDEARLAAARPFGVDLAVRLEPGGRSLKEILEAGRSEAAGALPGAAPLSVALDYSGVPGTMEALLSVLGIGGTLVLVGATFPQSPLQVDAERVVRQLHTLRGLHNYNERDLVAAVEFIEAHHERFPFASLVQDRFDLDQVGEAFAYGVASGAHRVGLRCRASG